VPFCALGGISALFTLISPRPALLVNDTGIWDNTTLFGAGLIKWEEIAAISSYRVLTQRYLAIVPRDLEPLLSRQTILQKWTMLINAKISPSPINIPDILLRIPSHDLVRHIRESYSAEIRQYHIYIE
jgi:hypothetical protein